MDESSYQLLKMEREYLKCWMQTWHGIDMAEHYSWCTVNKVIVVTTLLNMNRDFYGLVGWVVWYHAFSLVITNIMEKPATSVFRMEVTFVLKTDS
jgi:hypothetical protein